MAITCKALAWCWPVSRATTVPVTHLWMVGGKPGPTTYRPLLPPSTTTYYSA